MNISDLFKKKYTIEELNLFRFFAKVPVFEKLSPDEIEAFVPYLHNRSYNKEEVIFFRNDPAKALYIVKTGKVILNIDVNDEFEFLKTVKAADSFGNDALLANAQRRYNAIADSDDCELFVIPQVNILEIFQSQPEITSKMMASLASVYQKHLMSIFKNYQSSPGIFDLSKTYEE